MAYPYPDEPTWWKEYKRQAAALYARAGEPFPDVDGDALVHFARPGYDIGAGMSPGAASVKHLAELGRMLGLAPALAPLGIEGQFFTVGGQPWTMIECSDFNLLNRYVRGEDIQPILQQRRDCGFNTLRVWTAYDLEDAGIGRLIPSEHPDYDTRLLEFLRLCAQWGLYVELTAFTGRMHSGYTTIFQDDDARLAHWARLRDVAPPETTLLELVNEGDHEANYQIPWSRLTRPEHHIASRGSARADLWPPQVPPFASPWGFSSYHTNDLPEWPRKVGHNAMEIADRYGIPVTANENQRFPDKDSTPTHAYDAARAAALLCAGSCYHSARGKSSQLWTGVELDCAVAWALGARSVPLEFQRGAYRHRTELERPDLLRVYSRTLPDGREYIVEVRR